MPASRPDAPTIVVVPGGPGSDIMRSSSEMFPLSAAPSEEFNVIYTDARGSGCNDYASLSEPLAAVYRIEEVSRDLIDVIRDAKLTNYIIYGISFGTTAATVATALLEREGGPFPKRVVLEGAVGRAPASFDEYFDAFEAEWLRVKTLIPTVWKNEFEKEPWPAALGWSREQWGMFVSAQLIIGDIPGQGHALDYWLRGLSLKNPNAEAYVSRFMAAAASEGRPSALFETIACRELWGSWKVGREIRDGQLVATGTNLCTPTTVERYDSANFVLKTPITYFQGPFDPTTTVAHAQYHFDHQTSARRQLVTVPAAAHAPLTIGLAARGCARSVWKTLDTAPDGLSATLASCTAPGEPAVTLTTAP